jgi:uncharacterized protein (TIGR01732 family)
MSEQRHPNNMGSAFALIVVLFILLFIVGTAFASGY